MLITCWSEQKQSDIRMKYRKEYFKKSNVDLNNCWNINESLKWMKIIFKLFCTYFVYCITFQLIECTCIYVCQKIRWSIFLVKNSIVMFMSQKNIGNCQLKKYHFFCNKKVTVYESQVYMYVMWHVGVNHLSAGCMNTCMWTPTHLNKWNICCIVWMEINDFLLCKL